MAEKKPPIKKSSKAVAEQTVAEPKEDVYIHENVWTAQMVGKDFFFHHDTVHVVYHLNPMERLDFTEQDTF